MHCARRVRVLDWDRYEVSWTRKVEEDWHLLPSCSVSLCYQIYVHFTSRPPPPPLHIDRHTYKLNMSVHKWDPLSMLLPLPHLPCTYYVMYVQCYAGGVVLSCLPSTNNSLFTFSIFCQPTSTSSSLALLE